MRSRARSATTALCARARALQGAVSLHRGDLRSALDLVVDAERYAERCDDVVARVEVAALKGQVSFFTGSYAEALSHAERSVQLSDQTGDDESAYLRPPCHLPGVRQRRRPRPRGSGSAAC